MYTISIANFKGGTGKTATAVNLAALLAREGRRVLLIDADAQHNATDYLLPPAPERPSLTDVLDGAAEAREWRDVVLRSGWSRNLDVLAADTGLLRLDLAALLSGTPAARLRLADFLAALEASEEYDYVLFDCPPSFTAASTAALCNSDRVILPTRADAFSIRGAAELVEQIESARRQTGAPLPFKLLLTMTDRSRMAQQAAELIGEAGYALYKTRIRASVAVGESSYARQPLYKYAPKSGPAQDYESLLPEIMEENNDGEDV